MKTSFCSFYSLVWYILNNDTPQCSLAMDIYLAAFAAQLASITSHLRFGKQLLNIQYPYHQDLTSQFTSTTVSVPGPSVSISVVVSAGAGDYNTKLLE